MRLRPLIRKREVQKASGMPRRQHAEEAHQQRVQQGAGIVPPGEELDIVSKAERSGFRIEQTDAKDVGNGKHEKDRKQQQREHRHDVPESRQGRAAESDKPHASRLPVTPGSKSWISLIGKDRRTGAFCRRARISRVGATAASMASPSCVTAVSITSRPVKLT